MATAMMQEIPFTEARNTFSTLFDKVFSHKQPTIVYRKGREEVFLIRRDMQKALLSAYCLDAKAVRDTDGSYTVAVDTLDLVSNGETLEQAIKDMVQELKMYANEYISRLDLFLNAPNRRDHFPFIMRVMLAEDDQEIRSILCIQSDNAAEV